MQGTTIQNLSPMSFFFSIVIQGVYNYIGYLKQTMSGACVMLQLFCADGVYSMCIFFPQ